MSNSFGPAAAATGYAANEDQPRSSLTAVVIASSIGTVFEWYDFLIFGSLAPVMARTFFSGLPERGAYIAALAMFGVGFAFRPIGALVFGRIGDRKGRKRAFLVTVLIMGFATVSIGLLPTFAQVGVLAPVMLLLLRIAQGFALGGEYGGAAIYVAEHAPAATRGRAAGWVQSSAGMGLLTALLVILATRLIINRYYGATAFEAWGWRIPFLLSAGLLGISIFMRLKLSESPVFLEMKAAGKISAAPYAEVFTKRANLYLLFVAIVGILAAQTTTWYTTFFYTQTFLIKFLKVPETTVIALMLGIAAVSVPLYLFFGWLSDILGRKAVMLAGTFFMLAAYFPGFYLLSATLNPDLVKAQRVAPVVLAASASDCSIQFDPLGMAKLTSACDIARAALANAGVSYRNVSTAPGLQANVNVGAETIPLPDFRDLSSPDLAKAKAALERQLLSGLGRAGYPTTANPSHMKLAAAFGILLLFAIGATAIYGPLAAFLVELFPARIRYTALSFPYHLATGWIGGFLPVTAFAIVASMGSIYAGLWYPFLFTALSAIAGIFLLKETKGCPLD